jgi:plasmid stabilization system protein ParE
LFEQTQILERHPNIGRRPSAAVLAGVRELVLHRNYVALYRVDDDLKTAEIIAVKHVAQCSFDESNMHRPADVL